MALAIDWTLDRSEPLSTDSLLGQISLSDGVDGIQEDSVYIDSWLEALARAASKSPPAKTEIASYEILEESMPLKVTVCDAVLVISFRDHCVRADSWTDFQQEVARAGSSFLGEIENLPGAKENSYLKRLKILIEGFDRKS